LFHTLSFQYYGGFTERKRRAAIGAMATTMLIARRFPRAAFVLCIRDYKKNGIMHTPKINRQFAK
jgi:hypothetical protein